MEQKKRVRGEFGHGGEYSSVESDGGFAHAQIYGALTVSSDLNVNCDKDSVENNDLTCDNDLGSLTVDKTASAQQRVYASLGFCVKM